MSMRLFALLFTALFIIGALPMFFLQPFGSASAGVTTGFMAPITDIYHVTPAIAIGLLSAWIGQEMLLLTPLSALLMISIGSFTEIDAHHFHAVHGFVIGAIILFSLCVSMIRHKSNLLWILPISVWAYFSGTGFMHDVPSITTPLFYLIGVILSCILLFAIGMTLGITLSDPMHQYLKKFKISAAYATFLSLF